MFQEGDEGICDRKRPAEPRRELDKELCARRVDLDHIIFQPAKHFLILVQPFAEHDAAQRRNAGDDQPDVVFCSLQKKVCRIFVEVLMFHPAEQRCPAHRTENDPVLDLHVADLPRREQGFIACIHTLSSLSCVVSACLLYHRSQSLSRWRFDRITRLPSRGKCAIMRKTLGGRR